jgi:hypothetical protein
MNAKLMRRNLFFIVVLAFSITTTAQNSQPALSNKDVLLMNRSGLNDEVISEKVRNSNCAFDTSPAALAEVKTAGVSDVVILEMIRCDSRNTIKEKSVQPGIDPRPANSNTHGVSFVKHPSRRWRYSFISEKYDDISDHLQTSLIKALQQKGFQVVESSAPYSDCCLLTLELLEVNSHPGHKVVIDVRSNLVVTDASKRMLYTKQYTGYNKKQRLQWYRNIHDAVELMADSMAEDESLTRVLARSPNAR